MPRYELRADPTRGDLEIVAHDLRDADALELAAIEPDVPFVEQLVELASTSSPCFAADVDGVVAAVLGIVPDLPVTTEGLAWFVGRPVLTARPAAFWRACRDSLPRVAAGYDRLWNRVDTRYAAAIRWLEHLGFTRTPGLYVGRDPDRTPFVEMELICGRQGKHPRPGRDLQR